MLYFVLKCLLFLLYPETAHKVTLKSLYWLNRFGLARCLPKLHIPITIMGLNFYNHVGICAGFDKNGEYIDALAALGFGFIEVGTVTPKAQSGNFKPRLFRIKKAEAVINRLGFNNKGVEFLVEQLKKIKYRGILGINIGKNKDTPNEKAIDDYLYCFRKALPFASYITINISSPNTPDLRSLQHGDLLRPLLRALKAEQHAYERYVPLVVKISPDLTHEELQTMATIFLEEKIDGVIATNTTLSREGVAGLEHSTEAGGLSGKPLTKKSTEVIRELSRLLNNSIPIIGCGGIMNAEDANEKLAAGASLVQLYTGLIYRGPKLISEIIKAKKT